MSLAALAWPAPRKTKWRRRIVSQFAPMQALSKAQRQQVTRTGALVRTRAELLEMPERTRSEIDRKLARLSEIIAWVRTSRVPIFREMARLERKRGGEIIAATYCLRIMRWLGEDRFGDLPFVMDALTAWGFTAEAHAAEAMYGATEDRDARCLALLRDQVARHRTKAMSEFETLIDRRGEAPARVAVIVSLYNAAAKLPTLLKNIEIQSVVSDGGLEVVLIDSGSPASERAVFEAFAARGRLPLVYGRSAGRETIQAAWNRGIQLARAPYLSFLGVDEGLHPDCLKILSDTLDANPQVDWAMANSIVTEVDRDGIFSRDIMPYDRTGYHPSLVALETCYLSWVGGLYRKSIHDRFGYYDESFRAAGDTEFKGRVLRDIETMHVPRPLGVFNNYPEERTTNHPRAEIEDLRAWYLHRTPAGIDYSFADKPASAAEDLFRRSLRYRKSYCGHASTDFDMAVASARHLCARDDSGPQARHWLTSAERLLGAARRMETLHLTDGRGARGRALRDTLIAMQGWAEADETRFGLPHRPIYELFNDNRYEQHWWTWSS